MKIYILLSHPNKNTLNGALADAYEKSAIANGHEVRRQNLGEMRFDPILWQGYQTIQPLEPDLKTAQENILWCEHWAIFYPVWWGAVPAIFKGFIDRALLPGFAFKYHEKGPFWDKLLTGRSAHLFTTSDSPWFWIYFMYRNSDVNMLKNATLKFCGISPVGVTRFSRVKDTDEKQRQTWIEKVKSVTSQLKPS